MLLCILHTWLKHALIVMWRCCLSFWWNVYIYLVNCKWQLWWSCACYVYFLCTCGLYLKTWAMGAIGTSTIFCFVFAVGFDLKWQVSTWRWKLCHLSLLVFVGTARSQCFTTHAPPKLALWWTSCTPQTGTVLDLLTISLHSILLSSVFASCLSGGQHSHTFHSDLISTVSFLPCTQVLLYSVQRKMWVPHTNNKEIYV